MNCGQVGGNDRQTFENPCFAPVGCTDLNCKFGDRGYMPTFGPRPGSCCPTNNNNRNSSGCCDTTSNNCNNNGSCNGNYNNNGCYNNNCNGVTSCGNGDQNVDARRCQSNCGGDGGCSLHHPSHIISTCGNNSAMGNYFNGSRNNYLGNCNQNVGNNDNFGSCNNMGQNNNFNGFNCNNLGISSGDCRCGCCGPDCMCCPLGCRDIGCGSPSCCPPIPQSPCKKNNIPCPPLPCCGQCTDQRAHHLNRSPYCCPCRPCPDPCIYRCCEGMVSSYAGHVPGFTYHSLARTSPKATFGTKNYMQACMYYNTWSKI